MPSRPFCRSKRTGSWNAVTSSQALRWWNATSLPDGVEAGAQVMRRQRIEAAVVDVVLARPHHLDGLLHRVRQHHRVVDVFLVAMAAPAEAAAHQHVVVGDLVRLDAERVGRDRHGDGLRLHAAPHLAGVAVGRHRGDRIQRLHLGVIDEIVAILGFDDRSPPSAARPAHRPPCPTAWSAATCRAPPRRTRPAPCRC